MSTSQFKPMPTLVKLLLLLAILAAVSYSMFSNLNETSIPELQISDAEHFKYGSIGSDTAAPGSNGLPYWIWRALPQVCPDLLPGGYQGLGLIYEKGSDRPIGFSKRDIGPVDMVGLNCAVCHTASVRTSSSSPVVNYPGSTSHQLDLWGYFNFLFSCGADERFNVDNVMAKIDALAGDKLNMFERIAYKQAIDVTKASFIDRAPLLAWVPERPSWGPGRVDTFNPYKTLLGFKLDMSNDHSIGTADFMTIYNQQAKENLHVHWDGNNNSVDERNISAALGAGATPNTLDHAGIKRVREYIWTLQPPTFPFAINYQKFDEGKVLYKEYCYECHEPEGKYIGQVVPNSKLGADPERTMAFNQEMAGFMNSIGEGKPWAFKQFRVTEGYVNALMDGVWLRAPFLHNGSVPTMRDLLNHEDDRPKIFYKGNDIYDAEKMGYVSDKASLNGKTFSKFDTSLRGNGNSGHNYGTALTPDQKDTLIEYMKTK
ncbi:MAG: hypothetical protein ACJAYN_000795 [Bermanella sp.]|jgi:hypothetical protein